MRGFFRVTVYVGKASLEGREVYAKTEDGQAVLVNLPLEGVPAGRNKILPYCAAHGTAWDGLDACPICKDKETR